MALSAAASIGCGETFVEMEGVIFAHCHRFAQRYNLYHCWDDITAEAQYLYLVAYQSYQEDKCSFRTWVLTKLRGGLVEKFLRKTSLQRKQEPLNPEQPGNHDDSRLVDLFDELGEDATVVVKLVLETPSLIAKDIERRGGNSRDWRYVLRHYLLDLGWSSVRIKDTFQEIARALQ